MRLTFRARLTLAFTALVALAGIIIVAVVAVFMRVVPTYAVPESVAISGLRQATPAAQARASTTSSLTLRSPSDILDTTLIVSIVVLVVLVAAGALAAWLLAGRLLRPLQAVNAAAQRAGAGAFDHRLALSGPRDEVRDLADTFDEMLGRLGRSFAASQRFAANASHELQTPLATTQTVLEVALADPAADATQLRAAASRVLEMNRRSVETVSALLDLAELDEREIERHPVDVVPLVRSAVSDEQLGVAARRLTVVDELPPALFVSADDVLLRQAISNLVRNAVRHNVDDGEVRISATSPATLVVENTGVAMTDDLVRSLTEPFVRGAGRVAGDGGHGLGLAIVESIARGVGGRLDLSARAGGGLVAKLSLVASPLPSVTSPETEGPGRAPD